MSTCMNVVDCDGERVSDKHFVPEVMELSNKAKAAATSKEKMNADEASSVNSSKTMNARMVRCGHWSGAHSSGGRGKFFAVDAYL